MTSVIFQPRGPAADHYADTVERGVKFDDYAGSIPPGTLSELRRCFPTGSAAMWGVLPGKGGNVAQYNKVRVGDVVMFNADGRFFACATVACLFCNPDLAKQLWGLDPRSGQTWEYMYALDEVRPLDLPNSEFNAIVVYKGLPRNFLVLDEGKSQALLKHLPLESRRFVPFPSKEEYEKALAGPDGDLDVKVLGKRRTEQDYLRRMLFPGMQADCHLCGHRFDIEFLVAAHIKKRAECSDTEKRDALHIVMAACTFGCDELFERGYITVDAGGAIILSRALRGQALAHAREHLSGKTLGTVMAGREGYFEWHRRHSYRG